jgi:hypothetical protein
LHNIDSSKDANQAIFKKQKRHRWLGKFEDNVFVFFNSPLAAKSAASWVVA